MQTWQKKKTTAGKAIGWYVNLIDASSKEESNEEVASKTSKKKTGKRKICVFLFLSVIHLEFTLNICCVETVLRMCIGNQHLNLPWQLTMPLLNQYKILLLPTIVLVLMLWLTMFFFKVWSYYIRDY